MDLTVDVSVALAWAGGQIRASPQQTQFYPSVNRPQRLIERLICIALYLFPQSQLRRVLEAHDNPPSHCIWI